MTDDRERGSGTVLSVSLIAVLAGVVLVLGSLASGFDAKHLADSEADFAALAGARTLHDPTASEAPCAAAERVLREAELIACTVRGSRVVVETQKTVTFGLLASWTLTGQAEAGPR